MMQHVTKKIKKMMIDRDISGAEIARRENVDRSLVNKVINNKTGSKRVRRAIARELRVDVSEFWPEAA